MSKGPNAASAGVCDRNCRGRDVAREIGLSCRFLYGLEIEGDCLVRRIILDLKERTASDLGLTGF
jgi:hypothetical protein